MVFTVLVNRVERSIGQIRLSAQKRVDVVPRVSDVQRRLDNEVHQIRQADIDDLRPGCLDGLDSGANNLVDLGAVRIAIVAEGLFQDADPGALQAVGIEILRVAAFVPGDRESARVRIFRIVTDDRVKHDRGVLDGSTHRAGGVLKYDQRRQALAADQSRRDANADEIVEARRHADRAAGIFADADRCEVGSDRGAGAGAGATRIAGQIVWIICFAGGGRIAEP